MLRQDTQRETCEVKETSRCIFLSALWLALVMRDSWKQHIKIWKWGYGSSVPHYQTYILTFSFHIVVYYAVTQRSLCLMLHKSRDVTSLVLYIPDARMLNAPHNILDGTSKSSSKIWNLGLLNFKKSTQATSSITSKHKNLNQSFLKWNCFSLQVKRKGEGGSSSDGSLACLSLWTRVWGQLRLLFNTRRRKNSINWVMIMWYAVAR